VSAFDAVMSALNVAIQRGFMRHDKYSDTPLDQSQRGLLEREIEASFWLALDDAGVELK
jgi:hypothetical protein